MIVAVFVCVILYHEDYFAGEQGTVLPAKLSSQFYEGVSVTRSTGIAESSTMNRFEKLIARALAGSIAKVNASGLLRT